MHIVHLLSDISRINFCIWNVVLSTIPYLEKFGATVEIWFPESSSEIPEEFKQFHTKQIRTPHSALRNLKSLSAINYEPSTIFISHGTWSWATKFGYQMKRMGYHWISVPHGMLEPWSMNQKWLKKQVYFHLEEKRILRHADALIAVGGPEDNNLMRWFNNVHHIPNGIEPFVGEMSGIVNQLTSQLVNYYTNQLASQISFLFLGRLHHKKGIIPLVNAWLNSSLFGNERFQLIIAGPDEGELPKLKALLEERRRKNDIQTNRKSQITNHESQINLTGPVYGAEKSN